MNIIKILGKKVKFKIQDNVLYCLVPTNNILEAKTEKLHPVLLPNNDMQYGIKIADKNNRNQFIIDTITCPPLSLFQLYQMILFINKSNQTTHKYSRFCAFLMHHKICGKLSRNINHKRPQGRYMASDISIMAGICTNTRKNQLPKFSAKGIAYVLGNKEVNIGNFIDKSSSENY